MNLIRFAMKRDGFKNHSSISSPYKLSLQIKLCDEERQRQHQLLVGAAKQILASLS